jgi:nuclear transport factor 2 (NTF2) superfamily protein
MDYLAYFRDVYDGFNRRDAKRVLAMMTEDVLWPNAWKGGRLVGRDAVRAYWTEQWEEINPEVTPLSVSERDDSRLAVKVRQVVRSLDDETLSDGEIVHVYEMRDGLIARMDAEQLTA